MRGSLAESLLNLLMLGIIPAHAGLTYPRGLLAQSVGDHPRACGAHFENGQHTMDLTGSSPRMRGSPHSSIVFDDAEGIIPAHAGLTVSGDKRLF